MSSKIKLEVVIPFISVEATLWSVSFALGKRKIEKISELC